MVTLTDMIYSESYMDFLIRSYFLSQEQIQQLPPEDARTLVLNTQFSALYLRRSDRTENLSETFPYNTIPKLFMPLDTQPLEASGIRQVQNQSILNLSGSGVLIGFLDTGIDYTHPAFLDASGRTRIHSIWDQTDLTGTPPIHFPYGSVYGQEEINRALASDSPLTIVPSTDELGHGTAVAGIAAGTPVPSADFLGAAPNAGIVMVKLKPAKKYLRDYYFAADSAVLYQENDIIAAFSYLIHVAENLRRPLIICLALGCNQGSHSGTEPLASVLSRYGSLQGVVTVVACGNEAGRSHHYTPVPDPSLPYTNAEIRVPENSPGFFCEIWGQPPQELSVGFRSPLGETIPRIPITLQQSMQIRFALEETLIYVNYNLVLPSSGSQLILLRFKNPTPGIWNIRVYSSQQEPAFNIWLPMYGFSDPDITFLSPNPYTTLTTPSDAEPAISVSTYNSLDGSLYLHSSRGYTRTGGLKPDLAAPGVALTAPGPTGSFVPFTGSSAAAAITAGAAALLMEWDARRFPENYLTAYTTKIYLIRGTDRREDLLYPNREWGYGTLDLYQTFLSLMTS
ncbi:S8 family peptidase [Wansuia hejianensis]|uniref:S8 family peptidase n=1 Tax=Wansuia hejianensis TaxID=2763667 RepID=A0A7G9GFC9_9FIRM|nr:S8 family peptidase [Wansuia hejianensis]QNM09511.1 S8 family peptidase [Wansuia hejianensis]RHV92062.1 protease [Lachnospiraceae bacterium OF09-33XD]